MFPSPAKDYVRRKQTEENLLSKPGMLREDFVPLTLSTVALSDQKQPCPEPPERGAYSPRGQAFAKSLQHRYLAAPSRPRVTVNKHPCSTPVHAVDEQRARAGTGDAAARSVVEPIPRHRARDVEGGDLT